MLFIVHEIGTERASDKHASSPPSKRSFLHCSDEHDDANDADDTEDHVCEPVSVPLVFKDVNGIYAAIRSVTAIGPQWCKEHRDVCDAYCHRSGLQARLDFYFDDCGARDSGKGAKVTNQCLQQGDRLIFIVKRSDLYCTGGLNGKWTPLSPQPASTL